MRVFCVGLLVAAGSAVTGCTPGINEYFANYNGFPLLGMAQRAADKNPNDELIRTPTYTSAQRFNKPAGGSDGDSSGGSSVPVGTTTPFDQQPTVVKSEASADSE